MRADMTRARLRELMREIARTAPRKGRWRVFFVGGATAVFSGWREASLDADGNVYVGGTTSSSNFPTTPGEVGETQFCLVPLPGHTRGHCGVALRLPHGWLLHCGDAYIYHGNVDLEHPRQPPYHRLFRPFFNVNRAMRSIGAHAPRLRQVLRANGDEVTLTCTHDPVELDKFG